MSEKKIDRRALKTRKAVFEALAELLTEKELRKITVQELSDKADIHRVTLYKHFYDIYDVYEQLENTILTEVGLLVTDYGGDRAEELYNKVLKYITENPMYFKMVFSPHNTGELYQSLLKIFEGMKKLIWSEKLGVEYDNDILRRVLRYHANGCFAVISDWVTGGFDRPQEYIINTLSGLEKNADRYLSSLLK